MHAMILSVTLMLLSANALPASRVVGQNVAQVVGLPDNPCEVLTRAEMSTITGLDVTAVRREPSIAKMVRAQREHRKAGPGALCSYETRSGFGAITISVPPRAERTSASYWAVRKRYFDTYRGSARVIPGLGLDAWLAGGADLHVLVRQDEYFMLATQTYQRQSRELLVKIATAILHRR
jgi:hypothetical protein